MWMALRDWNAGVVPSMMNCPHDQKKSQTAEYKAKGVESGDLGICRGGGCTAKMLA